VQNSWGILVCETLRREVAAVVEGEGLLNVKVVALPLDCCRPINQENHLNRIVESCLNRYDHLVLIGGNCTSKILLAPSTNQCTITHIDGCFNLLLPEALVNKYQADGAYLLTPGWLAGWSQHIMDWGFDHPTAQTFFAESCSRLVLLDTELDASSPALLMEFSAFLNKPYEVLPVGLDMLQLVLTNVIQDKNENTKQSARLQDAKLADYGLVFDAMSRLVGLETEEKVAHAIFELFDMICIPSFSAYLPFQNSQPGALLTSPKTASLSSITINQMASLHDKYKWSDSGTGFLFRSQRNQETLGIWLVEGIALPQNKEHYLNLILNILPAIAMAISNARNLEQLLDSQTSLAEQQENLSTTLRSIGDGVISTDAQGHVVNMNPVAEELTGWAVSEAAGHHISDILTIVNALTDEPAFLPVDSALATGEVFHMSEHTTLISRDGTKRQISDSAAPIRNTCGEITGVVLVFSDITEQYNISRTLRESEEQFRSLFEGSRDAVMTIEPPTWKFTSCNQTTLEMFGAKDVAEFTCWEPWSISPEIQSDGSSSIDKFREMIEIALREGSHLFEWMHKRANGEVFPCTLLLSRIELAGNRYLQGTVRDITAQKQAEVALVKRSHDLAERMKEMRCLYDVSHILQDSTADLEDISGHILNAIIAGYQYPEVTGVRLRVNDTEFVESFRETTWKQTSPIVVAGDQIGVLEVCYREERPDADEGPFLTQERDLLDSIASHLEDFTERKSTENALQHEKENLAAVFASSPIGMMLLNEDTMIVDANTVVASMVSRSLGEVIGQRGGDGLGCVHSFEHTRGCGFSPVCSKCELKNGLAQLLSTDISIHGVEIQTILMINGQERRPWLRISAEPVAINKHKHVIVAMDDITERKQLSLQLEDAVVQVKSLMDEVVDDGCFTGRFSNPNLIKCWETKSCNHTNCPAYRNQDLRCWEITGTFCQHEYQGTFAEKHEQCKNCRVYRLARANPILELGETFNTMSAILEFRHNQLNQAKADLEDMNTQLERALSAAHQHAAEVEVAKEQIEVDAAVMDYQARHDALTGLPNRLLFSEELDKMLINHTGKDRQCAVLFLDLDKFKMVNDTMGHKAGDILLVETATRLSTCLRESDLLARMGGDEFTVLLKDIKTIDDALVVAQRMLEIVSTPYEINGTKLVIGVSIGGSIYPDNAIDAAELLRTADAAMYKAKELGRNNFQFFCEELSQENHARVEMEREIRLAIERDELKVYYQPIVDTRTMQITGAEALLRWDHPDKGIMSPGLFIPIAEDSGMVVQMGKMVLETACKQCKFWQDTGYTNFEMSVNVSPIQLGEIEFISTVDGALSAVGLHPGCLKLEVTESILAKNENDEIDILSILKSLGLVICLDDFGIGYSSLSRLNNLPIGHIKIDGYFIKNIAHNHKDRAMTESIIVMAHNLGIQVTAEWIEDEEQMATIRSLNCDYAQGYMISPALSADNFTLFLHDWKDRMQSITAA